MQYEHTIPTFHISMTCGINTGRLLQDNIGNGLEKPRIQTTPSRDNATGGKKQHWGTNYSQMLLESIKSRRDRGNRGGHSVHNPMAKTKADEAKENRQAERVLVERLSAALG